jgi:hypothetical protein
MEYKIEFAVIFKLLWRESKNIYFKLNFSLALAVRKSEANFHSPQLTVSAKKIQKEKK